MACTSVNKGRNESCKDNVGGIKNIYVGTWDSYIWDDLVAFNYWQSPWLEADEFTAAAIDVYKYELKSDANTFEETNEVSNENQTSFWTQTLTVNLKKQTGNTQDQLVKMSKGQVVVVIEDYNGNCRAAGLFRGLDVQANTSTGGAMGDMNGYTVTMTGVAPYPAYYLDDLTCPMPNGQLFNLIDNVISDN